ncbi:MAG TPA: tryptophan 7-halogenase, partial [Planctomycetaceae bacterium]|nr:tryptophan 7-halogenase [Planctomycetaceae bacterium]
EIEHCPAVKERIAGATRVSSYHATRDYSYRSTKVAGNGYVMVGDAFGFLDPLYSSGVLLALKSGEMAADAIVEGLEKGDLSESQLGKWGPTINAGIDRMRRLVCEYYDGFSFGRFVRSYPHLMGTVTDLLIGDLFTDKVDVVWEPMESLYRPGKTVPGSWNAGTSVEQQVESKSNEQYCSDGATH